MSRLHDELAVQGIRKPTPRTYNHMDAAAAERHIQNLLGSTGFVQKPKEDWGSSQDVWAAASQRFPNLPGAANQSD